MPLSSFCRIVIVINLSSMILENLGIYSEILQYDVNAKVIISCVMAHEEKFGD